MLEKLVKQRTYALVGSGGCGKTSIAEAMLVQAKVIPRLGKIEHGTTTLDYEPEEIKRRGSIQPGFAYFSWQKSNHYLVDIPGDTNFHGDIQYLLTAVDGVVFVLDVVDGVKPMAKKVWQEIEQAQLPALMFLNKLDRELADFESAYKGIQKILGVKPVLLFYPIGSGENFQGLVDVLAYQAYFFAEDGLLQKGDIPANLEEKIKEIRISLIEDIAESDETLMEKYLTQGELSPEELLAGLRKGVLNRNFFPVCLGAALENKGINLLLNFINGLLPCPLDRAPFSGENNETRASDPDAPCAAFVFKTIADPFTGHLSVLRVLSGKIGSDMVLFNANKGHKEKLGQLFVFEGKKQIPLKEEVGPGAIVAVAKLKDTKTGHTLCAEQAPFRLKKPALAPTIISYALAAEKQGEEDKVFASVQKILDEDITLHLARDEETGDMLLSGMGQLHIETTIEKIKRRYKVGIVLQQPKIPYRETIKSKAEAQGKYKKQTGGRGQYGDCWIRLEPLPRGKGYEFVDAIVGGVIPKQYIPAVDAGIQEAAQKGVLAGYPVVDFKVTLYDGSYHSVDSSEMAFKIAGSMAFKNAVIKSKPVLLEPIMKVTIYIPDQYMGDIIGDISSRRGKVLGSDTKDGLTEVKAEVPMAEMLSYAQSLTSMTSGQGTYVMEFDHYAEVPAQIAEKIIAESKNPQEH
ncbi:MAG: elongation factor G [Desulfonauticus sp.]|nr:elongation factor G [Desulfonauticus sp.]